MTTAKLDRPIRDAVADMEAAEDKTLIVTSEGGEPVAFMMPIEVLNVIEDLIDGQDALDAIAEAEASGEPNVPWGDFKARLGL